LARVAGHEISPGGWPLATLQQPSKPLHPEIPLLSEQPLPIVPYLKIPESGSPYLEGQKCSNCGAITFKERLACGSCGGRDTSAAHRLSDKGTLHAFSIVYRAFPGIEVPFISAIADLEGGGTIKTNLIGIDPDPDKIELGMSIEVVYQIAPRKDGEGNEYMTYCLKPAAA
jgi:uncharacterized OB-fold protein